MSTVQAFDASVDALKAILWQYDNAERLKTLVRLKQEWYQRNHTEFWENWTRDVFDIRTANDFGLSVWARILDIPLLIEVPESRDKPAFGFGVEHLNFGNGNFARGNSGTISLTLEQKRMIVRLRYFQLTSRGTVPEINTFLKEMFGGQGDVFVVDSLDMTYATYFFSFQPNSQVQLILEKYDLLPRPAAVGVKWQVQAKPSWGFGTNHLNFENGNFGA